MNFPTPIQPVVVNPENFELSYHHVFMKEGVIYYITYYGSKYALRKQGDNIEFFVYEEKS